MDYHAVAAAPIALGIFGTTLNTAVTVIILIFRDTFLTPLNVVLLGMAIVDLMAAAVDTAFFTASAIGGEWFFKHMCHWYAWFVGMSAMVSVGHVTLLAVLRCVSVTRPERRLTIRHSCWEMVAVVLLASLLASPPLLGCGRHGLNLFDGLCDSTLDLSTGSRTYALMLLIFGLLLPLLTKAAAYRAILRQLRQVRRRLGIAVRPEEERLSTMMVIEILAFLVSWTPYAACAVAVEFFQVPIPPGLTIIPLVFVRSSGWYNPVLYSLMNTQFRTVIRERFAPERNRAAAETVGVAETRF